MHTKPGGATIYGFAVMADMPDMPQSVSFILSRFESGRNIYDLDSITGSRPYYCKKMTYDVHADTSCHNYFESNNFSRWLPCNFYLFDNSVYVPDTFMTSFVCDYNPSCNYHLFYLEAISSSSILSIERYIRIYLLEGLSHDGQFRPWTGGWPLVFPILNLCPSPRIPIVGPNYTGHTRISWHPGDTSLYQLAFYSYDNDNLLFETDTLTETSYTVTDTTTPVPLQEGWYNVRLRKGCDYMDSPYHTVVWSEWSEPKRFYYIPRPEPGGIATPTIEPPFFTLSPNPAVHDITLSFEEPLPEGSILELYGPGGRRIEIFSILQGTVKQTIDTQKYPSGLYLLRLSTPTSATSRKLSIIH
ncbi:MAG: T9SS type A sorting domain-containing protein [Bacteroidales bacterium]|nr:T9SS type A sorting domain-containing protein [Bacteroidales bacterium]